MKITSKGQVTIPQEIREKAGLHPYTDVEFIMDKGGIRLVKKSLPSHTGRRGKLALEKLSGKATVRMTTDQIMALTRGTT